MTEQIKCEDVIVELYGWLDNESDPEISRKIDHHMHECRECFSRAEFERLLRRRVAGTAEQDVPEEVQQRIESLMKRF